MSSFSSKCVIVDRLYARQYNTYDIGFKVNEDSLIFKISRSGKSMLFLGDMSGAESVLTSTTAPATVLKVSHHGYNGSTSDNLLNLVRPKYSIVTIDYTNISRLSANFHGRAVGELYYTGPTTNSTTAPKVASFTMTDSSTGYFVPDSNLTRYYP